MPNEVSIEVGGTVTWEFPWYEPHTVTITPEGQDPTELEPMTGSAEWPNEAGYIQTGLIPGDPEAPPTFSVTSPRPVATPTTARSTHS